MEIFAYIDYLKYQKFSKRKTENQLNETDETYYIAGELVNNEHDKIFRKILEDKKEVGKFINKALNLEVPITSYYILGEKSGN